MGESEAAITDSTSRNAVTNTMESRDIMRVSQAASTSKNLAFCSACRLFILLGGRPFSIWLLHDFLGGLQAIQVGISAVSQL